MAIKSFGNWQYERLLGCGGFGQVELWKEKFTNKKIAIKKCMLPKITPKQKQRWEQEINNMKNFKHPNIVKSESVPDEMHFTSPVLCMEFCNKGDLRKVLNKAENACGLLQNDVLTIMKDISSALKFLHHHNITHRDLKPENIVLHEQNDMVIYKLIDLGYAKDLGSATATASLVGTFNYVAPELFWKRKYTCSVDYWSLGILFFEILTGYKPFTSCSENLTKWVDGMRNKKYNEICAEEINGNIQFYDNIIYPNDLSENILNSLIEWFQIVLQWDPRQRGKRLDCDEIVVFPLLQEIFPWKTIYIFLVSLYRIERFNVNNNITLKELQQWIEQKTRIPISEQVITDSKGNLLNKMKNSEKLPLENIKDVIYVYENYSLEISEADCDAAIPKMIDRMLVNQKEIKNRSSLRQCYTAIIYFMRHEIMLLQHYIFALGIKLDIINERLNTLNNNIQKSLPNAELLLNEMDKSLKLIKSETSSNDSMQSINNLYTKVKNVHTIINDLNSEAEITQRGCHHIKEFFNNEKLLYDLQEYSKFYEDFLNMFVTFENERIHSSNNIIEKLKMLSEIFIELYNKRNIHLRETEIIKIIRQLVQFEKKLHSHLEVIKSSMKLIISYKNKFSELLHKINLSIVTTPNTILMPKYNTCDEDTSIIKSDDTEIRDNIVLRAIFDKCIQDIQENWSKMIL